MLTLLFNVLVSASPKEFAGDVGALRGVVNNVSSALGAAFAGVVAVTSADRWRSRPASTAPPCRRSSTWTTSTGWTFVSERAA